MRNGIKLSPKHGVNPAVPLCFFCNEQKNEVVLPGYMGRGDPEAPRAAVWDMNPCDKCAGYMKQGVILISINESQTTDPKNPYRTGGWCVVKDAAIERMLEEVAAKGILEARFAFVPDEVWDALGLPREDSVASASGGDL
jgi:hypothetical protein